jgi:hypothetical protein
VWLRGLGLGAGLATLAWAGAASAANIGPTATPVTRSVTSRVVGSGKYDISFEDCLSNDTFSFPLTFANTTGRSLEVWVGNETADCTQAAQRQQINPVVCRKIFGPQTVSKSGLTVQITDKAITEGIGVTSCQDTAQLGQKTTLFFMLKADAAENVDASNVWKWTDTIVDLVGPEPPVGVSAGVGDGALIIDFTKSDATDIVGYNIYWDDGTGPASTEPQPAQSSASTGSGAGGSSSTSTTTSTDDAGTSTAAGSWPPPPPPAEDAGAGGAGGSTSSGGAGGATTTTTSTTTTTGSTTTAAGGSGGSGGTSAGGSGGTTTTSSATASDDAGVSGGDGCPVSKAVISGRAPDHGYASFVQASGPATVDGLTNGKAYVIGVVARDKIGNLGRMSNVACGTPAQVSDFFSIYRQEGGRAGGGCSVAGPRDDAFAFAVGAVALLGLGLAGRRRSTRSTKRGSR